ncbi:hypothetical protein Ddc_17845 [Ditylenchus destructor]|nr:hypothetical protein Ddc_17845 [Ditylenchus destructor]
MKLVPIISLLLLYSIILLLHVTITDSTTLNGPTVTADPNKLVTKRAVPSLENEKLLYLYVSKATLKGHAYDFKELAEVLANPIFRLSIQTAGLREFSDFLQRASVQDRGLLTKLYDLPQEARDGFQWPIALHYERSLPSQEKIDAQMTAFERIWKTMKEKYESTEVIYKYDAGSGKSMCPCELCIRNETKCIEMPESILAFLPADEPSTSRGANSEKCCAVCDHDAALFMLRIMACCAVVQPIDRSPVIQGSQDGKFIASIVRVNEEMCKVRRKGIYIGYERQTVGDILTSGTNYVSLWHQYENKVPAVKGVELKSSNLVQTTNFLPFDIYLNIEFLKTIECFRLLGLEDQVKQIHRTALAITLFNEAYVSRCDGYQKLVLPGGMVPLAIEYPENVHLLTLDTIILNGQIKKEFSEIVRIKNIPEHEDFNKTLDEILTVVKEDDQLRRLNPEDAVLIYEPKFSEGYENNPLARLLTSRILEPADDIPSDEMVRLHSFMWKLASRYYQLLKDEFHEEKEVHVVPIGKLKNEPNTFLLGVIGMQKKPSSDGYLKGIAGIVVNLERSG